MEGKWRVTYAAYTAPLVTVTTVFGVGVCDRLLRSHRIVYAEHHCDI